MTYGSSLDAWAAPGAADRAPANRSLTDTLFPVEPLPRVNIATATLPPPVRPDAAQSVLDVTEFFGETSGGIRTYLLEKAKYVEAHPALRQVLVVPGPADAITDSAGVRCYRLAGAEIPGQKPYRFMLSMASIRRIAEHERPAVIEVGSPALVPWLVRWATSRVETPLVYFYHSNFPRVISAFPERDGGVKPLLSRLAWRYARQLDRLFALTIVTSQFSADELHRNGIDRVVRVPLGADLAFFNPSRRASRDATRTRHGLPLDRPVVGFVGRFAREKELDVLLDAWRDVARRTDAVLVLIGDGPKRAMLEARATADVRFLPFQTDRAALADLHAALDVYVAPSSVETFGLSSLESLASGTPLLAADRGGVAEQVRESGAGATFEAGSAASLAERAGWLLQQDLAALGARGRAYVEREHGWDRVFDRLFTVYRDVVNP